MFLLTTVNAVMPIERVYSVNMIIKFQLSKERVSEVERCVEVSGESGERNEQPSGLLKT